MMEWRVRLKEKAEREGTAVSKKSVSRRGRRRGKRLRRIVEERERGQPKRAKPRAGLEPTTDASSRAVRVWTRRRPRGRGAD